MIHWIRSTYQNYLDHEKVLNKAHIVASILARFYIAQVFFNAGLTKIQDWDTTLFLFEEEYQVPFLSFELAAVLGTMSELTLPILLFTGLLTRLAAIGLFIVNLVAVISLIEIAPAALYLHYIWGLLLTHIIIYGSGPIALDNVAQRINPKMHLNKKILT
ncbi:DoxX family protein [Neptuniibacter sp. QD48_11]|uniref:DoxX family protein n=1 Tax=unclassified Neptuniibacter TaxID=2630693 RepID=UPI0039F472F3